MSGRVAQVYSTGNRFVIARSRGAEVVDVGRFCDTPRTHKESEASKVAGQEVCWQTRMRQSIKA